MSCARIGASGPSGPSDPADHPSPAGTLAPDDGGTLPGLDDAGLASRCTVGPTVADIRCTHESATIDGRAVLWQTPLGTPPDGGWPLVMIYQGSLLGPSAGASILEPSGMWAVKASDAILDGVFSNYILTQLVTQTLVIKRLLDTGFAVITPTADLNGTAWDTNLPPWDFDWPPAPDNPVLLDLFAGIAKGSFGPLSTERWYATGVSSGGYMTSRMAVSYPGKFRALVVVAGSYATCGGPVCSVPALPSDHPPTLFLHGGSDPLVPVSTMYAYRDALAKMGIDTKSIVDPNLKHGLPSTGPFDIPDWFTSH